MNRPDLGEQVSRNVVAVRAAIAEAAARAGRSPADVCLVAVTKYAGLAAIRAVLAAGVHDLGESRVQQLRPRVAALGRDASPLGEAAGSGGPRWHMIGHLQRNKVKYLLPDVRIVHSVDSMRLVVELDQAVKRMREGENPPAAPALGGRGHEKSSAHRAVAQGSENPPPAASLEGTGLVAFDVLIEVNVAGEASKDGVEPAELPGLAAEVARLDGLRLRGLMTMAPLEADAESARPHFARLRELLEDLLRRGEVGPECVHLSMGMSHDYAVAVEEGATLVRVGSALFEGLSPDELAAE